LAFLAASQRALELLLGLAGQAKISQVHGGTGGRMRGVRVALRSYEKTHMIDLVLRVHGHELADGRMALQIRDHFVAPLGQPSKLELSGIVGSSLSHG
jgi:hypothetical protein